MSSRNHTCIILTPLNPAFMFCKTGVYRVYNFFLIFAPKHRLWVLIRPASPSTHNLEHKCEIYQNFLSESFHFLVVKFSVYLNRHVFVMYLLSVASISADVSTLYVRRKMILQ